MPVIVLVLVLAILGGLTYGGMQLYAMVAASLGVIAAMVVLVIAACAIAAPFFWLWKRHRSLHGRKRDGQRVLSGDWPGGRLRVDALNKQGFVRTQQGERHFIFADIAGAAEQGGAVALSLLHPEQTWLLPVAPAAERRRWVRILILAQRQDL